MSMLSRILHPRRSRRRDEYISGSSLASSEISKRLVASSSKDRGRPIAMKFGTWKDPDCPVMKWYGQQTESSTKFTMIQHFRESRAPFYHEYLLIHLDDGAICRLERMGQGSRADAIRRVGCTAHDIIQWFAKDTYANDSLSEGPSELVIGVEFSRSFDLLDVLAICFSIQKVKLSSAYTLQRYNCYFLCLAVLSVLVRRTAEWESVVTNDVWVAAVNNMVNEFETMECKEEYETIGIGLCAMVNPDTPEARKLMLDPLREALHGTGLFSVSSEIGNTLWHEDLKTACHNGLTDEIERATKLVLEGTDISSIRMKRLFVKDASTEPADGSTVKSSGTGLSPRLHREINLSVGDTAVSALRAAAKSAATTYAMREVEVPTPLYLRLLCPLMAGGVCVALVFGYLTDDEDRFRLKQANIMTRMRVTKRLLPVFLHVAKWIIIQDSDDPSLQEMERFQEEAIGHAMIIAYSTVLRSALCEGLNKSLILRASGCDTDDWRRCLRVCVGRHLDKVLTIAEQCSSLGAVNVYTLAHPHGSRMSVTDFQKIIIKRIHDHADRVAAVRLAAAPLVQSEIERTMAEVWRQMPNTKDWNSESGSRGDLVQSKSEVSLEGCGLGYLFG